MQVREIGYSLLIAQEISSLSMAQRIKLPQLLLPEQRTLSIPTTFIAPGSIAATTSVTAGNGITATTGNIVASAGNVSASGTVTGGTGVIATTGNITATAGNFVSSTAGDGIVLNSGATSGTTTATLNGRSGQITITTPSIAAGASVTMTITNSAITGSGTQVLYTLSGGTPFAALTVGSVTNSAGSPWLLFKTALVLQIALQALS